MPCFLVVAILAFPRAALILMFLFTTYLQRAYHGLLLPLLGFIFLPLTTVVYAWLVNSHRPIEGINLLFLVLAVVIDAGGLSGGEYHRRRRN
jgi:uncharacterized oligopeptide transporter (OPT) family protein